MDEGCQRTICSNMALQSSQPVRTIPKPTLIMEQCAKIIQKELKRELQGTTYDARHPNQE